MMSASRKNGARTGHPLNLGLSHLFYSKEIKIGETWDRVR